jgi:hypothetical protein
MLNTSSIKLNLNAMEKCQGLKCLTCDNDAKEVNTPGGSTPVIPYVKGFRVDNGARSGDHTADKRSVGPGSRN